MLKELESGFVVGWRVFQIWRSMRQSRIICAVSLAGHPGRMDRSTHYAEDGEACYSGPFHSDYYITCRHWLEQSWTMKFIESRFASLSRPSDMPLFLAVLKKTRSLLAQNGTRFVIVLWDQNELAKAMIKALRANEFDVIALSSIVSESDFLKTHPLIQSDRHPSPATNKAIAAYLWKRVGAPLAVSHFKSAAASGTSFR